MSVPTPTQSLYGGLGLALPVYSLLKLNGSVFGISGFLHRAVRGAVGPFCAVSGLVSGGALVGLVDGQSPESIQIGLIQLATAGLLVGSGTKLANGCTSGHMICGISRFSKRSIIATTTFFSIAIIVARIFHSNMMALPVQPWDRSLGPTGSVLMGLQACSLAISIFMSLQRLLLSNESWSSTARNVVFFNTACSFAFALRLSNLTSPERVIRFLLLPFHPGFDPSLAFLAFGALPLSIILYHIRGEERPQMGGEWMIPKPNQVDLKLVFGSMLFGIGWGIGGVCPGPALVNLGRSLTTNNNMTQILSWIGAFIVGSFIA